MFLVFFGPEKEEWNAGKWLGNLLKERQEHAGSCFVICTRIVFFSGQGRDEMRCGVGD